MYEESREVYCSQIGRDGTMKNSTLVDLLQDCSNSHLNTHPVLGPFFEESGFVMFLVSRQVDIIRRPVQGERLRVVTCPYELNRMYGFRNTYILDQEGNFIVKSIAGGAFMDLAAQRPVRIPKEVLERIELGERIEMEYLPRKIALPDREPDERVELTLRRADIDMNRHVNNARYFELADECVSEPEKAWRLRAEYMVPLKYGEAVTGLVYREEGKTSVALTGPEGKPACMIEYIDQR